jgi:hypothetical protein
METKSFILAVASVVVGWLLSEVSQSLRSRGLRSRALGRALAELLEIRHALRAIDAVFGEMQKRWPISRAQLDLVLQAAGQILPPDAELPSRFSDAVTEIASVDPLLAFRLRSKDQIPGVLMRFRALQLPSGDDAPLRSSIEDMIRSSVLDEIDEAVKEVAWYRGVGSWVRVRLFLRGKTNLPEQVMKLIELGERAQAGKT